jgi:hypothetical protein
MNKINLYVNGCSWTDGDVLDGRGVISHLKLNGVGRDYSYPTLVSNELNFNLIDESRYGGSINRITRMTWDYIIKQKNSINNTIFLLEIPNGFRDEIYSSKFEKYFNITGGLLSNPVDKTEQGNQWDSIKKDVIENYYNFHNFDLFDKEEYTKLMSLILYIKNMKAQIYLLQPYELLDKIQKYNGLFNNVIEEHNIIKLESDLIANNSYKLIEDMCFYEKISIGHELNDGIKDSHPGVSGHNILSKIIINHIKKYNKFETNKLI